MFLEADYRVSLAYFRDAVPSGFGLEFAVALGAKVEFVDFGEEGIRRVVSRIGFFGHFAVDTCVWNGVSVVVGHS